jgi:primosomal protein N' (replication factor Y)
VSRDANVVQVALAAPLDTVFDYRPPAAGPLPEPGQRVRVPFGRGERCGVVSGIAEQSELPGSRLKPVAEVLDDAPLLRAEDLAFLTWSARYYHHPVGEVVCAALPVRLRRGEAAAGLGVPGWTLTEAGQRLTPPELTRAPRQAEIVAWLQQLGGQAPQLLLREALGDCAGVLRGLRDKGYVSAIELPPAAGGVGKEQPPTLHAEQAHAVTAVRAALGSFAGFLLAGVTGSGKTEVYLRLAEQVLARGDSVLLLVPEIGLTPQLVKRFARRLGDRLAVLHSGLGERERELAWQRARLGLAPLVIGTRSAVFTPMPRLGLVLVDEEHDGSFKQQDGFRYNARDLAVVRAQRAGCPVLLGSATPSLESLKNVRDGRYQPLQLTERAGGAQPPRLDLLDVRGQPLDAGLSPVLKSAIGATLAAGQQALVFLNRRGFAPVLSCYGCGWLSDCPRCDARQTLHAGSGLLWCHHCGAQRRLPTACPDCGSTELHPLGAGTERLEQVLAAQFPDYPLVRIDRDATARKGSLDRLLEQVGKGEAMILVGTQMLAKGHHFPDVTLVGVLDVDGGLFGADFRAAERMAQLILQVAGRAGRGAKPGRVLIQTRYPEHPLLQTLVHQGYDAFADAALAERREAQWPPYSFQALLRAEATDIEAPQAFLSEVYALAAPYAGSDAGHRVELWGPVPAPMTRRAGRYRAHLLLQAEQRTPLHTLIGWLLPQIRALKLARKVRWSLDVDPQDLL